jgi:hypothetical protein
MDIFKTLLSVISPQGSTPAKSSQEFRSLSLSAFAQEICARLKQEIKALPKERGISAARGLLQATLTDFEANLIMLGDALDDNDAKRTYKALDMLERLCRVSFPIFVITFILMSNFGIFVLFRKLHFSLAEFENSEQLSPIG